jgi:SAM-dependent methyltransferase
MDEAFWDERYRSRESLWSGEPNPQLVREAAALTAGRALDVGCGEGADAIWLAERGWSVDAVDISHVALHRARQHAAHSGDAISARITWKQVDLLSFTPGLHTFDLVAAHFVHLPPDQRSGLHRRLAESVVPGGTLLIVNHDPSDLLTSVGRPPWPEYFATATEVAETLPPTEWEIVVAEARPRSGTDADGRTVEIHDAVTKARRRAVDG